MYIHILYFTENIVDMEVQCNKNKRVLTKGPQEWETQETCFTQKCHARRKTTETKHRETKKQKRAHVSVA